MMPEIQLYMKQTEQIPKLNQRENPSTKGLLCKDPVTPSNSPLGEKKPTTRTKR